MGSGRQRHGAPCGRTRGLVLHHVSFFIDLEAGRRVDVGVERPGHVLLAPVPDVPRVLDGRVGARPERGPRSRHHVETQRAHALVGERHATLFPQHVPDADARLGRQKRAFDKPGVPYRRPGEADRAAREFRPPRHVEDARDVQPPVARLPERRHHALAALDPAAALELDGREVQLVLRLEDQVAHADLRAPRIRRQCSVRADDNAAREGRRLALPVEVDLPGERVGRIDEPQPAGREVKRPRAGNGTLEQHARAALLREQAPAADLHRAVPAVIVVIPGEAVPIRQDVVVGTVFQDKLPRDNGIGLLPTQARTPSDRDDVRVRAVPGGVAVALDEHAAASDDDVAGLQHARPCNAKRALPCPHLDRQQMPVHDEAGIAQVKAGPRLRARHRRVALQDQLALAEHFVLRASAIDEGAAEPFRARTGDVDRLALVRVRIARLHVKEKSRARRDERIARRCAERAVLRHGKDAFLDADHARVVLQSGIGPQHTVATLDQGLACADRRHERRVYDLLAVTFCHRHHVRRATGVRQQGGCGKNGADDLFAVE